MAYQNNIPAPTDQLSQSQQDIQDNFAAIKTLVDVNHVTFDTADQGKHKFVTFPVQGSAPTFNAGEVGLYNAAYATTGVNELFVTNQAGTSTPITASNPNTQGWTYLPSGILLKWGTSTVSGLGNVSLSFGPAFSAVYSTQLTPVANGGINTNTIIYSAGTTTTQLSVYGLSRTSTGTAASTQFYYLVIGR